MGRIKAIYSIRFNNRKGCCGIVVAEDEATGERRLYAGVVGGTDRQADEIELLTWGNRLSLTTVEKMLAMIGASRNGK